MHSILFTPAERGFSWIHFYQPDDSDLDRMAGELAIPGLYIQDILQAEHLPKVEPVGDRPGAWFLIARILDPELGSRSFNSISSLSRKLAVFYAPGQVVSVLRSDSAPVQEFVTKSQQQPAGLTDFQLVAKILKVSFRSFEPLLLKLGEDVDFFEGKLLDNERFPPLARSLYGLRRKASVMKRLMVLSEPLIAFLRENGAGDPIATDAMDMFTRIETLTDDVFERAVGLINLNLAVASQRSNEIMRFLTLYSAFFLPVTFLVGVYGMNFRGMPELELPWGYPAVWILILLLAGFHFWWFRRKKWL